MRRKHLSMAAIAFAAIAVACGAHNVGSAVRPADLTAREALGESGGGASGGTACKEHGPAEPLIVDWKSSERQDLELAMKDGIAVVSYDCKSIRLLKDCHVASPVTPAYKFAGVTITEDGVQLKNADELAANLPLSAARISSEMKTGSSIDLAIVTVGRLGAPMPRATRADLVGGSPACDGATHYVRFAMIGAFVMETGTAGHVRAAAELFGAGGAGESSSEKSTSNRGGVRADCNAAKPDDAAPPGQCRAATRISLVPIDAEGDPEQGDHPVECAPGLVWTGKLCATASADVPHACKGDDLAECSAQCAKLNGESCYRAGRLKLRDAKNDTDKLEAIGFDQKGCDASYGRACRDLGYIFELAHAEEIDPAKQAADASSALSYYEKACNFGDGEACQHAADCYEDGRLGAKDTAKTVKLTVRGCDLGYDHSCLAYSAIRIEGKFGTPKDAQTGLDVLQTACNKPSGGFYCTLLGDYYRKGDVVAKDAAKAMDAYERACARYWASGCWKKGAMLATGEGVPADFGQARTYLRKACPELTWGWSSGSPDACVFLGAAYESGTYGFVKDPAHALEIYEDRCQRWSGSAMCAMAAAKYEEGAVVKRDAEKANALYRRGCASGNGDGVACAKTAPLVAKDDPKLALAMYRRACFRAKDLPSCTAAGDLVAQNKDDAKHFWADACSSTQLPQVCARSTALGNP